MRRSRRWSRPSSVTPQTLRRDLQELSDRGLLQAPSRRRQRQSQHGQRRLRSAPCRDGDGEGRDRPRRRRTGEAGQLALPDTGHDDRRARQGDRGAALRVACASSPTARRPRHDPRALPGHPIQITGGSGCGHNRALGGAQAAASRRDLSLRPAPDQHRRHRCQREPARIPGRGGGRRARHVPQRAAPRAACRPHEVRRVATCRLAHLREVDTLVTDRPPSGPVRRILEEAGCELIVAPPGPK